MTARFARLLLLALLALTGNASSQQPSLAYSIDLNHRADDRFKVTLTVSGLTARNAVYQFASTAPGTYQVMNIGRFVRSFEAFDARGKRVPVERVSVNQWKLSDAPRVRTIRYSVAETWDTKVERHSVYLMCGTSIEADHTLINPHAVIGYPTGLQAVPVRLRLAYPATWKAGTAAHAMQLRSGLKSPDDYLATIIQKMSIDRSAFDSRYSLRELALTSYSDSGQKQYANIYMRGALTAGLLDIRLLELSHGRRGLQDVTGELTRRYGKRRAFPESSFVDTLVAMTYPEIRDFFGRYVWESEKLPIKGYYAKLGIRLIEDAEGRPVRFEIDSNPTPGQLRLRQAWLGRKPAEPAGGEPPRS